MMRGLIVFVLIAAAFFSTGCKDEEISGGYVSLDSKNKEVKLSLDFLKKELSSKHPDVVIKKIISAESQIVAGQKIELKCEYVSDVNKEFKVLRALIFITLEDKYILEQLEFIK